MKVFLLGYGKLGQAISEAASQKGHQITGHTNSSELSEENFQKLLNSDVAIEVSTPDSAVQNIQLCLRNQVPVVVGTTGWYEKYDECAALCKETDGAMLCATNFSIGVNIFFELNKVLADLMNSHKAYTPSMNETHHIHKVDSPSGTAISLAQDIIGRNERIHSWIEGAPENQDQLQINAMRSGEVPGTHEITYKSEIDSISIKHEAHNRKGFALGAVIAAEWIQDKKGIFGMNDVITVKKS